MSGLKYFALLWTGKHTHQKKPHLDIICSLATFLGESRFITKTMNEKKEKKRALEKSGVSKAASPH